VVEVVEGAAVVLEAAAMVVLGGVLCALPPQPGSSTVARVTATAVR
jgi:hypothetical protein